MRVQIKNEVKTINVDELEIKTKNQYPKDYEDENWPFISKVEDLYDKGLMQKLLDLINYFFKLNKDEDYNFEDFLTDFFGGQVTWGLKYEDPKAIELDNILSNTLYRMAKKLKIRVNKEMFEFDEED